MIVNKPPSIDTKLKPCKCGGQLCVGQGIRTAKNGFTHFKIVCRKCGAWHGGITRREGNNENN